MALVGRFLVLLAIAGLLAVAMDEHEVLARGSEEHDDNVYRVSKGGQGSLKATSARRSARGGAGTRSTGSRASSSATSAATPASACRQATTATRASAPATTTGRQSAEGPNAPEALRTLFCGIVETGVLDAVAFTILLNSGASPHFLTKRSLLFCYPLMIDAVACIEQVFVVGGATVN